jgi:RimJ/RimL family protein N-acetyltransferase
MKVDFAKLEFRRLTYSDFNEFKRAAIESVESNYEYLWFGQFFERANLVEMLNEFSWLIHDPSTNHFGLFQGSRLLGHIAIAKSVAPLGAEIYGWVRKGYHSQGVGELGLNLALQTAFQISDFNYVELSINEKNAPSRQVAKKLNFTALYCKSNESLPDSTKYVSYVKFNPRIEELARRYARSPLQIMNCPATIFPFTHYLLQLDSLVSFYEWPFDTYQEHDRPLDDIELHKYLSLVCLRPEDLTYLANASNGSADRHSV